MEEIADRGLARAIGVSNYGDDRLAKTVTGARRKPAVNQVLFTPFHYRRELVETCERLGVGLESYSPLEQGRALDDPTVVAVARRVDRTPAQVLLRWGVQKNTVVIPKSSRRERIVENAQIFDFELGDDDMQTLDALDRTGGTGRGR
jgi:diketogulonate reductase-like aldo/keto reductase